MQSLRDLHLSLSTPARSRHPFKYASFKGGPYWPGPENDGKGPDILIRFEALGTWFLIDAAGNPVGSGIPPGQYTLRFPANSPGLMDLIIDPDPGGGEAWQTIP